MAEAIYNGPLDRVRRINEDAGALDEMVRQYSGTGFSRSGFVRDELVQLNGNHPLRGQEVMLWGEKLVPTGKDELADGAPGRTLQVEEHGGPVVGKYCGYNVLPFYSPVTQDVEEGVAHAVEIERKSFTDAQFNKNTRTFMGYVLASGSSVETILPINTHSFEDLRDDRLLPELESLALDERVPTETVFKKIGSIVDEILVKEKWRVMRNYQRVSYINSLGLQHQVSLLASDMLVGRRDAYIANPDGGEVLPNDMSNTLRIRPQRFDILPSYWRLPDGEITTGGPCELFATSSLIDGRSVMVPFKSVLEVKADS